MATIVRRIAAAAVMIGIVLAGTLVFASPAQAACRTQYSVTLQSGTLSVINRRLCWDPDVEKELFIRIERLTNNPPSNPRWVTVAQGYGRVNYKCIDLSPNFFRINGSASTLYACY